MSKNNLILVGFLLITLMTRGQQSEKTLYSDFIQSPRPFLFSMTTLTDASHAWSIDYSGGYGERISGAFGYAGIDQQIAVQGYLGNRFTLFAKAAVGFPDAGGVSTAQQAEVVRDIVGGKKAMGFRLGLGLGGWYDYERAGAATGRITAAFDTPFFRLNGNMLFEKAFASDRDAIDVITSIGFQYRVLGGLYAGVEALGEDLEGFWDDEEAEGGAKVLVGPSINLTPLSSGFSFSFSGGPVIYATQSQIEAPSEAIRDLPVKNGFTVRARIVYTLFQI